MNDALTLTPTHHDFRTRASLPITRDDAWERLTTQWLPNWLGLTALPLMVGSPLIAGPGKDPSREGTTVGRVLGSALGHRMRFVISSRAIGAPVILQVGLLADGSTTSIELDIESAPDAEGLETLRQVWQDRLALVEREVTLEMNQRFGRK